MASPLSAHAAATPDRPAVIEDRPDGTVTTLTFGELDRQANRLANALLDLGVGPGDAVVWCGPNSPDVVRAMHALPRIGAVAVPLNYRLTAEEATYILDDADAGAAYVDAELAPLFAGIRPALPRLRHLIAFGGRAEGPGAYLPVNGALDGDALLAGARDTEPAVAVAADAPTAMLYTSGTTGRPKGAVRRPADPEALRPLLEAVGHRPDDVYITTGPLYHSGPGGYLGIAHRLGNTAVVQRRFDPEDWLRLVDRYRVTATFSAPTPIRMVVNLPAAVKARYDRSSMKRMIANAAPWSYALKLAYLADFPEDSLWEVYGSTELGVNTVLAPADQRRKPGSCGRAVPGVEIALVGEDGREVTHPYVPGEVYVRSAGTFVAYHKAESATRASRRGDFASVGDVAYRDDEGYYHICDRKSDMIISGGMNVYPAEVEAALERHPGVVEAAAFGIPSEEWGESVHAVVVPRPGHALDAAALMAATRTHLAGYKLPRSVSFADELPRTGSGKVLRRVLREPYWKDRRGP
ncbi:MAG TPA: AMP-binding protein [Candidatus Binatia bacterium]|nr:AMP-binding protein [Candidatus Binatia bacterium]